MTETTPEAFSNATYNIPKTLYSADYTETLETVARQLVAIHRQYFETETGPDGTPWKPWYFRCMSAAPDHKILDSSGRLKQSLESGPDHIESISENELTWGTSVPYSYQHQFGGTYTVSEVLLGKRGEVKRPGQLITLPKREHVGINSEEVDRIANEVGDAAMAKVLAVIDSMRG